MFVAIQVDLQRDVALKLLRADLCAGPGLLARFERQARVTAGLSHANLVRVYASGILDGQMFYAMELSRARICSG